MTHGSGSLRHVLVAMDFSPNALLAWRWALRLAQPANARVRALHVIEPDLRFVSEEGRAEFEAKIRKRGDTLVREAAQTGVEATFDFAEGKPWDVLVEAAEKMSADLVVLGSRGLNPFDRILLGSVADRVVRRSTPPVLTVHPNDAVPERARTILVATDFTKEADIAAEFAARLIAGVPEAKLILLHVCMPPIVFTESDVPMTLVSTDDGAVEAARERIEEKRPELAHLGVTIETRVGQGYAAEVILSEASLIKPDVIALGAHRRGWLDRLLLGSIAERIVHHADRPVLTVRAAE